MSVAVNGGPINILLADTTYDMNDFVRSMTSDATTLYWVDLNQVRSMAKTGGPVTNLAGPRTIPPAPTGVRFRALRPGYIAACDARGRPGWACWRPGWR